MKTTQNNQDLQSRTNPDKISDVKNPDVEARIKQYNEKKTQENLSDLIEAIRHARLLVPAVPDPESTQPVPILLQRPDGKAFFPVYTAKRELSGEGSCGLALVMPYRMVNQLVAKEAVKCEGIVINPFSDRLVFSKALVNQIEEMGESEAGNQSKTLQLTEKDYVRYERKQFEYGFLPKTFFEMGASFLEQLSEKKEAYLDELFESSYQQKRLYPYLREEFSVMVMNISERLRVIRADLPARDMTVPSCYRIYFSWDAEKGEGHYFVVEKGPENGIYIGEIAKDWGHLKYGPAPAEGAELNKILSLIQGE